MKEFLFIITSAINTPRGIFGPSERLEQTINTIHSIRKHVTNPVMVMVDSGTVRISDEIVTTLHGEGLHTILKTDHTMELSQKGLNSPAEMIALVSTLQTFKDLSAFERVFKISGRYYLTDDFDLGKYDGLKGKYAFKEPIHSWMPNGDKLLITRLWSMCPSLTEEFISCGNAVVTSCLGGLDLEHSFYKNIAKQYPDHMSYLKTLGVEGRVAPNGILVTD